MANTGYTWGAYGFVQKGAGDWTSDAIANAATETGDSTSVNGKAAAVITITATEDNTGAVADNSVTVYILNDIDGSNFEEPDIGNPFAIVFTPVQSDTVRIPIPIDCRIYKNFRVAVLNESGQELAISVRLATADIPVAS